MTNIKPVFQEVSSMEMTSKYICPVLYCSRADGRTADPSDTV